MLYSENKLLIVKVVGETPTTAFRLVCKEMPQLASSPTAVSWDLEAAVRYADSQEIKIINTAYLA